MDIRTLAVQPSGFLHLLDANDSPLYQEDGAPVGVYLYGPGSKEFARANAAQQNRLVDKLRRKGKSNETAEQKRAEAAEFLADITKDWQGVDYNGLEGRAKSLAIYQDIEIGFIADQASKFVGEWGNFTSNSSKG